MSREPQLEHHDPPAAGNQFTLRGIFLLMTALSVILAVLALVIKQPQHWLGVLGIVAVCLAAAGILELGHRFFPPPPRIKPGYYNKLPPIQFPADGAPPASPPFGPGENPFAEQPSADSPRQEPESK